jgi:protoporphyrinogen oxidase
MDTPHVVILGGGPAGVGAAYSLRRENRARVTLIEQQSVVGGNAGSFEGGGQRLDYGSHRLHPACDPVILSDIRSLLGNDLLDRPRHGRIRLRGKWIHFPLAPLDLLLRLDRKFALNTLRDMAVGSVSRSSGRPDDTFASVLMANLGPTICEEFYFPYARKIWGRDPSELSGIQARRRVSAGSFGKLIRKVFSRVPGLQSEGVGRFFYPRRGYGQISESYARAASELGADILLQTKVTSLRRRGDGPDAGWVVTASRNGQLMTIEADQVWSTIPITLLARLVTPAPEQTVRDAASSIEYRGMILVYLELAADRFSEYDAHYFPGADLTITRLSEPKNYAATEEPRGRTTLCAELPCSPADRWWQMSDEELAEVVTIDLARAGIPLPHKPVAVLVKRLHHAYPIYASGYEGPFEMLDAWAESLPDLLTYGRQGLFAHDNTHHALFMAYSAVECLRDGVFDRAKWEGYRRVFANHVVED